MKDRLPIECFLRQEQGGLLLLPGERVTPDIDPFICAAQSTDGLSGVARQVVPGNPAAFILSLLQRHVRQILMTLLNGHDLGFDGRPPRSDGRMDRYALRIDDMRAMLRSLRESGISAGAPVERALAELAQEPGDPTIEDLARFVSAHYRHLGDLVRAVRPQVRRVTVTLPRTLQPDKYARKDEAYRSAVAELTLWARSDLAWAFEHLSVFGSMATLDYVRGSSDIDLFGILKREVVDSPDAILRLRKSLKNLWPFLYRTDPLQHHGILIFGPADIDFYSQADFPLVVLKYALTMVGEGGRKIVVSERDSAFERLYAYNTVRQYFRSLAFHGVPHTAFHYKLFVNTFLLFPAFALQIDGKYRYKKYTFGPFLRALPRDCADVLRRAMAVWSQNLYGNAEHLGDGEDGLAFHLRARAQQPSPQLLEHLGPDFAGQVLNVCEAFEVKRSGESSWRACMARRAGSTWLWRNPPQAHSRGEYDEARSNLARSVEARLPNAELIEFGSVRNPGISDIDVILAVGRHDALSPLEDLEDYPGQSPQPPNTLFFHPPSIIVSRDEVDGLKDLYPIFPRSAPGAGSGDLTLSPPDNDLLIVSLAEMACHYFWTWNRISLISRNVDVRLMLLTLGGLKHSFRCLRASGLSDRSWDSFELAIDDLRESWFASEETNRRTRLLQLTIDSLTVTGSILAALAAQLPELVDATTALPEDLPSGSVVAALYRNHYFVTGWCPTTALRVGMLREARTAERALILPAEFAALLAYYQNFDTPLGRFLRANFQHKFVAGKIKVAGKVERRRVKLEGHLQWLADRGATWGGVPHWPINPSRPEVESANISPERIVSNMVGHGGMWFDISDAFRTIDQARIVRANASALYERGDYAGVLALTESGAPEYRCDGQLNYLRSLSLSRLGHALPECIDVMDRAIALGSDPFWSHYQRACLKVKVDDIDGAIEDLMRADALSPDVPIVQDLLQSLRQPPSPTVLPT
ncbi:hypothetical protein ACQKQD_10600 [Methylobacterium sp. NPDC080182]|uniref:hypothetical protein n=1 Tax=Methylobacterium sp. NPDC080182 TaxID=3390590 RepID=UPI003D026A5A